MMEVCIHCGARALSSDDRYCYQCGERLPSGYEEQAADATSQSPTESGWRAVLGDLREIRRGHLPVHVEVVARITASSFVAYVLALGDFSDVIPPSQRALIGELVPLLSLLMPTLLFSVGAAVFPLQMIVMITALAAATMLLACAAGVGTGFYVFAFGLCSLCLSGTRFNKSTGSSTAVLIMQMALNTQGFTSLATEQGIGFVSSLWKTDGSSIGNPDAAYVSGLVGMMWVCLGIVVGRVLPPFRTMRKTISRAFLPSALRDVVAFIYSGVNKAVADGDSSGGYDDHYDKDEKVQTIESDEDRDEDRGQRSFGDSKLVGVKGDDFESRREVLYTRLLKDVALLAPSVNIAVVTAFEPRLLRFGPQECSYLVLGRLCDAVSRCALSVLAASEVLRDRRDEALQRRLAFAHRRSAEALAGCAAALEKGTDQCPKITGDGGGGEEGDRDDKCRGADDCGSDVPFLPRPLPVDPLFLTKHSKEVEAATGAWAETMGPPDYRGRSFLDKDARSALKSNITPWVVTSINLWLEIGRDFLLLFRAESWKRIVKPPYYDADKFMWCVKFAVGFTALVAMGVYWEAFKNLEVPVMDDGMLPAGAHFFSGWYLIAYAMSTTQTVEGTVKKGVLRILGTAAGGFSGWLAITACGSNVYGLIAWATIFTSVAAYNGLQRGIKARLGMDPDLGFAPAYFVMTQALVIIYVYIEAGGKDNITVNRILANATGIAMAIVMAFIPPGLYGGNPKFARAALEEMKEDLLKGLRLVLEHANSEHDEQLAEKLGTEIDDIRTNGRTKISRLIGEADDFYKDSSRFQRLPCFRVDPDLKDRIDSFRVLAAWIYVVLGYASHNLEDAELQKSFMTGVRSSTRLCSLIEELKSDSSLEQALETSQPLDQEACKAKEEAYGSYESAVFVHYVVIACRKIHKSENALSGIKWGAFS